MPIECGREVFDSKYDLDPQSQLIGSFLCAVSFILSECLLVSGYSDLLLILLVASFHIDFSTFVT